MISIVEQLKCAKRELSMRERVYPNWINAGRMDPAKAAHEIECMQSIVATLEGLQREEDEKIQPSLL